MTGGFTKRVVLVASGALISTVALLAACQREEPGPGEQKKIALAIPRAPAQPPQGMAAVRVRLGGATAFTKQDVVKYFKTHNLPMNMTSPRQFEVESVELLTDAEVAARLGGASPGLRPEERVAFATLRGLFVFTGPPGGRAARFLRAYAVFDAKTGNLLMVGTLEPTRQ